MTTNTTTATSTDLEKFVTAAEMRADGATFTAIGKALGVSDKTAARYVAQGQPILEERAAKAAEAKGSKGGGKRKAFDADLTAEVVAMREDGMSWLQIAEEVDGITTPGMARRVYRNAQQDSIPVGAPLGMVGRGGRLPWVNKYPWATDEEDNA